MKKIIFYFLISILPIQLFAYDISFSKKFSKTVTPDILTTYISVNVESEDEKFINRKIEEFHDYIKDNDDVTKKNGSFVLNPKYRYYKNKQEFMGFMGILRYEVSSKNAKELNRFIDDLIGIKKKVDSRKVKINISNLSWKISEELYNSTLDDLRINVITWVSTYANTLSSKVAKECSIKNINIHQAMRQNYMRAEVMAYDSKGASDLAPENSDKNITINPNFVMECK